MSAHEQQRPVIEVVSVTHRYRRRGSERVALEDVSLTVHAGEMLAIVGESGAGKSTLARLITGLEVPTEGQVLVDGRPPRPTPGRPSPVQMIFQHPTDALNPLMSVGRSVAEPLRKLPRDRRAATVADLARRVGIDPGRLRSRPSAFSGGQLQRLGIARALAVQPRVLVCDEPTSALDVSVQAQIVNLLLDTQGELGFAGVLITHDLPVAKTLADRILVLKDGHIVESAPTVRFFEEPQAEYSRALIAAAEEQTVVVEDTEPSRR